MLEAVLLLLVKLAGLWCLLMAPLEVYRFYACHEKNTWASE